jgi:hypothetical protein
MADNLLDKASILLTPTAYDNGSMLSIKPENGDGDFTFSRAGNASRVNSSGNIVIESANIPRIDYTDGCGVSLLEPQSTNLVNNSELLNTYFYYKVDTTITDNYGTSPSGETNSSRIQFADNTSFCYSLISVSTDHTSSVFVKGVNGETVRFGIGVNVTTGDLFTFNGLWQRIDFTASSATQIFFSSYGGATTRDFEAFGLQLEALPYATSYIPTNGATNTRLQDIANNSGNSSLINSTEGVLYAEIAALANDGTNRIISLNDGTTNNIVRFYYSVTNNTIVGNVKSSGSTVFNYSDALTDATDFIKIALKYKENDFALWVNGTEVATDTSGATPASGVLNRLDFSNAGNTSIFNGKSKALAVFPILTDAELQSLTTQ